MNEKYGLDHKWEWFSVIDPFNPQNEVAGFLCKSESPKQTYGALYITFVNKKEVNQLIYATPKMGYPFDREHNYHFPAAKRVEIYPKLDGTNILSFTYKDAEGKVFTSYKTRLMPFIMTHRPFYSMWLKMIERYPDIAHLAEDNGVSISYELYGKHNFHLIMYDEDLDTRVLFGVNDRGEVLTPLNLNLHRVPSLVAEEILHEATELDTTYNKHRLKMEENLKELNPNCFSGQEGQVWYLIDSNNVCHQFKAKPETIEAIHFAAGATMTRNSVIATCWNVLEDYPEVNFDNLKPLLLEEWTEVRIMQNLETINYCIDYVNKTNVLKTEAINLLISLKETNNWNLTDNKAEIMRVMAQKFGNKNTRFIYGLINKVK